MLTTALWFMVQTVIQPSQTEGATGCPAQCHTQTRVMMSSLLSYFMAVRAGKITWIVFGSQRGSSGLEGPTFGL
jgi:hypothetical protein